MLLLVQASASGFLKTFTESPPAQHPGSFNLDVAIAKMGDAAGDANH